MIEVKFTIADLPRSAFKSEADAEEWLANNALAIRDNLNEIGNDTIDVYLREDDLDIDWDEGHFEAPKKPSQTDLMEAAMCLWEAVLSNFHVIVSRDDSERKDDSARDQNIVYWWEGVGTACVRLHMIDFAEPCHEAWVLAHRDGEGFDDPFDWEFVPWFVHNCIDWTEGGPELKSDWRELATKLGEK